MYRPLLIALTATILFLSATPGASAYSSHVLTLHVYSDGYVLVTQVLTVDSRSTSIQVPLLSTTVADLVATDQNGNPLSYGFTGGGGNITIYTLGTTAVSLSYESDTLTSKNGTVWTLAFTALYNSTVTLPQLSTVSSISGTPYSFNETDSSPELNLAAGSWEVSYGVPIGTTTSTTSSSTVGTSGGVVGQAQVEEAGGAIVVAAAVGVGLTLLRRRRASPNGEGLRPDDVKVLAYLREKGGKVLEPEIRMKFALPKTTAWRQIKRLERLGYVRITKIGSQNQVEILKEKGP